MTKVSSGPGTGTGTGSPMMVRRQLGRRLRALREATGRSRDDVVASRLMSRSKLEGIEHGRNVVRPGDAYELGRIYGASADELESLRATAAATAQAGWWQEYSEGLVKGFDVYLDLESSARTIQVYQPSVIIGLLQTREYARAIEQSSSRHFTDDEVEVNVRLRMERQRVILDRGTRTEVHAVLGEAALRCLIGGPEVMRAQLEHLRQTGRRDRVDVRVLTNAAGANPGALGPFTVFEFDDPEDPAVACLEGYTGTRYNDQLHQVAGFQQVFAILRDMSVPVEEFQL